MGEEGGEGEEGERDCSGARMWGRERVDRTEETNLQ